MTDIRIPNGFVPRHCADCGAPLATDAHKRTQRCQACAAKRGVEQRIAWHKAHPDRTRAAQERFRKRHPERVSKRASTFGVREDAFNKWLGEQGGRCDICGTDDPGPKGWNLDHDHRFAPKDPEGHRGILCRACNLMLGNARDSEEILERAIAYLVRTKLRIRIVRCG